jgi:uncharacterized protein DUF3352
MKARLALILVAISAALAGCGGGGGGDGGSGSTDPASLAPPDAPFFLEVTRPEGEAVAKVEALAEQIAGVEDLGEFIVSELESSALESGGELDYGKEIEPWLGKRAGLFLRDYDGDDFSEGGFAVETTDPTQAEAFVEKRVAQADHPTAKASYEGVDYHVDKDEGSAIGVIGDFLAYGEDAATFEAMVDASGGDSLADRATYADAVSSLPAGSVADLFVDIGGVLDKAGASIDAETRTGLTVLGIEPEEATAVASAIPGTDQIEVDISSDVLANPPAYADTSFLLSSLPGDSVVALTSPEAGASFSQAIDRLDREGIPDEDIPPNKLKSIFKEAGVDLDSIGETIGDAGFFLEGDSEASLGGAAVLISGGNQGKAIVAEIGAFLRVAGISGVTAIDGSRYSGFSIRNSDLGDKPLAVVTDGLHILVSYGLAPVANYYSRGELKDNPLFKEASAALGGTPISGFAQGPAALRLASELISGDDREGFEKARPYLSKIEFLALGSESTKDLAKAKLIVGIGD